MRVFLMLATLLLVFRDLLGAGIKRDETVFFAPTGVAPAPGGGGGWDLALRGYVFELEPRRLSLAMFQTALGWGGVDLTSEQAARFRERSRWFLVDRERRKSVVVLFGNRVLELSRSDAQGEVAGDFRLTGQEVAAVALRGEGELVVRLGSRDPRRLTGRLHFVPACGVSVVSDIDDTVKVSEVRDREALLRNTFLEAFAPVPGMAALYQAWAAHEGVTVHYLSASPWPLAPALLEFLEDGGFPRGPLQLRDFDWSRRGIVGLLTPPAGYKQGVLEAWLRRWPERAFVLVGDSGEQDPEIYGEVARRHPDRVRGIAIRDVTGQKPADDRYQRAFRDVPPARWRVFRQPEELGSTTGTWFQSVAEDRRQ